MFDCASKRDYRHERDIDNAVKGKVNKSSEEALGTVKYSNIS